MLISIKLTKLSLPGVCQESKLKKYKILFLFDKKESRILFDLVANSVKDSVSIRKCRIDEIISENNLIQFILLGCDYNCMLKKCCRKFIFLFQHRNIPFAIVRPILLEKDYKFVKGFFLSFFKKYDLTQLQEEILKKAKNSKHYGCSPRFRIHPLNPLFKIINIQREIVENPHKKLILSSLATLEKRSPSWTSYKFKEISRIGMKKFLNKIRYCYALWNIISTEKALKTIAAELGYKPLSFTKRFHSIFGISPSLFRKKYLY